MALKGFTLLISIGLLVTLSACQPAPTTSPQGDTDQEEVQPGGQVDQDDDDNDEGEDDN
jgi:hypothetical protein